MTACLFGTYVRAHSANRLLHAALAGAGFDIVECHEPVWEEEGNKPAPYFGPPSLARLAVRYAAAARRLARRWRARSGPPPLVVVGFGGQLDALLARRVCPPRAAEPAGRRVLFYGRYLPLHGIETIIAAAARLGPRAEFVLLGTGPERRRAEAVAAAAHVPVAWREPVPLAALPDELAAAAGVLGAFRARARGAVVGAD